MVHRLDPPDVIPHDLAVLDTCLRAVVGVWQVAPIPDVDSSGVRDGKSALPQDWSGLATALDHLAACPDLVTLLARKDGFGLGRPRLRPWARLGQGDRIFEAEAASPRSLQGSEEVGGEV